MRCKCGNNASPYCSDNGCTCCCKDVNCSKHVRIKCEICDDKIMEDEFCTCRQCRIKICKNCVIRKNDDDFGGKFCSDNCFKKYKKEITEEQKVKKKCKTCKKIIMPYYDYDYYECNGCCEIFCYDCCDYRQYSRKCEKQNCYYCIRGHCLNNGYESDKYCEDCFDEDLENNVTECNICDEPFPDSKYWICDGCENVSCYDCSEPLRNMINECYDPDCKFCKKGICRYEYLDSRCYCTNCFDGDPNIDTDLDTDVDVEQQNKILELIEEKKFIEIIKMHNIQLTIVPNFTYLYNNDKMCAICHDSNVECQVSCNHVFCLKCYVTHNLAYASSQCAMCKENISNNLIISLLD